MNEHQRAQAVIVSTIFIILGSIWGLNYLQKQREIRAWAFYGNVKYQSCDPPSNIDLGEPILFSTYIPVQDFPVKPYPQILYRHITFSMDYEGFQFLMPDGTQELLWVRAK